VDYNWLSAQTALALGSQVRLQPDDTPWWVSRKLSTASRHPRSAQDYMPWLLPEYAPLREVPELAIQAECLYAHPSTKQSHSPNIWMRLPRMA
jgi:hypothetical protein